jgi:hypothetical protein
MVISTAPIGFGPDFQGEGHEISQSTLINGPEMWLWFPEHGQKHVEKLLNHHGIYH